MNNPLNINDLCPQTFVYNDKGIYAFLKSYVKTIFNTKDVYLVSVQFSENNKNGVALFFNKSDEAYFNISFKKREKNGVYFVTVLSVSSYNPVILLSDIVFFNKIDSLILLLSTKEYYDIYIPPYSSRDIIKKELKRYFGVYDIPYSIDCSRPKIRKKGSDIYEKYLVTILYKDFVISKMNIILRYSSENKNKVTFSVKKI